MKKIETCGAHLLRDRRGLYDFEPDKQDWASQMACLLIEARDATAGARHAGQSALETANPPAAPTEFPTAPASAGWSGRGRENWSHAPAYGG